MGTRLGTIFIFIPKVLEGEYVLFFVTGNKRSKLTLVALLHELFINGVLTRMIEQPAHAIGIENFSASKASEIINGLHD